MTSDKPEEVCLLNSSLITCLQLVTYHSLLVTYYLSLLLGVNRLLAWLPFSLAESARLQGLNHAQGFFRRASDVEIVNHLVAQDAFWINHEETAQCDAFVFDQNTVIARDRFG